VLIDALHGKPEVLRADCLDEEDGAAEDEGNCGANRHPGDLADCAAGQAGQGRGDRDAEFIAGTGFDSVQRYGRLRTASGALDLWGATAPRGGT
jgi:hypothetical protein